MGFQALKDIEASLTTGYNRSKLEKLSSTFFTYIPHKIGRNMQAHIIDTKEKVKAKLELLQNLLDIQSAQEIMDKKSTTKVEMQENPLDKNYRGLNCRLTPIPAGNSVY